MPTHHFLLKRFPYSLKLIFFNVQLSLSVCSQICSSLFPINSILRLSCHWLWARLKSGRKGKGGYLSLCLSTLEVSPEMVTYPQLRFLRSSSGVAVPALVLAPPLGYQAVKHAIPWSGVCIPKSTQTDKPISFSQSTQETFSNWLLGFLRHHYIYEVLQDNIKVNHPY